MATTTLFLCGDVMTGRGVDQILPHPGDPALHEPGAGDAREYVRLAEMKQGPLPRGVTPASIWGAALAELDRVKPVARIINLETAVTTSDDWWPDKAVHYRMHPGNVDCLTAARIDVATLANNHTLDWGAAGLVETLDTLAAAGIATVGAGRDRQAAQRPALIPLADGGRVIVAGVGSTTSGIPWRWAATAERPGVNLLGGLAVNDAVALAARLREVKRPGDIAVVSIHWGSNWGHDVDDEMVAFAHALVDGGVDIVHGHSAHHVRPVEVYRGRLILYGCGECIDDYEGIHGYEEFRSDLMLLYFPTIDRATGRLVHLRMVPLQIHRLSLRSASAADAAWLTDTLGRISRPLGTEVAYAGGVLCVSPADPGG